MQVFAGFLPGFTPQKQWIFWVLPGCLNAAAATNSLLGMQPNLEKLAS